MKHLKAVVTAGVVTLIVACAMLAVGVNALANNNTQPVLDSPPAQDSASVQAASDSSQQQIADLQNQIEQYKAREQQYQSELSQANQQLQQVQTLLGQLQQAGLIRIGRDGRIFIRQFNFGGDFQ